MAAALCVALAFAFRPTPPDRPVQTALSVETVETVAASFPPRPAASPPEAAPPPAGDAAPCAGCLNGAAARDVAEALVAAAGLAYQDIRVERARDLPWYAKERTGPPVPADGLLDAPEYFTFGPYLPMPPWPDEEWWIVWFHVGWRTPGEVELAIRHGTLPEVAVAWPPIKREEYVVVDARDGDIVAYSRASFPWYDNPFTEWAYWSAKECAEHHLGEAQRATGAMAVP